jgi:hypothetical protein
MATFQLFSQSGRAKDLPAPLYFKKSWKLCGGSSSLKEYVAGEISRTLNFMVAP